MYSTTGAGGAPLFRLTCRPSQNFPEDFHIKIIQFSICAWATLSQDAFLPFVFVVVVFVVVRSAFLPHVLLFEVRFFTCVVVL